MPSAVQVLADSVVTVQARSTLDVVSDVAVIVLALSLAATFVALLLFLRRLAQLERRVVGAARETVARAGPLMDRGGDIADNVEFITRALRTDVERLNASVKALNDRLGQASDRMEERIEAFNALMEVVQSEAEAIFIDTASTVRGVREGARSLGAGDGAVPDAPTDDRAGAGGSRRQSPGPAPEGVYLTGEAEPDTDEESAGPPERRQEADHAPS